MLTVNSRNYYFWTFKHQNYISLFCDPKKIMHELKRLMCKIGKLHFLTCKRKGFAYAARNLWMHTYKGLSLQAARETGALKEAKDKLEKQMEELTWRLQLEKRLRVWSFFYVSTFICPAKLQWQPCHCAIMLAVSLLMSNFKF